MKELFEIYEKFLDDLNVVIDERILDLMKQIEDKDFQYNFSELYIRNAEDYDLVYDHGKLKLRTKIIFSYYDKFDNFVEKTILQEHSELGIKEIASDFISEIEGFFYENQKFIHDTSDEGERF